VSPPFPPPDPGVTGPRTLAARVVPPGALRLGRGRLLIERNLLVARRTWYVPLSGLAEPVFYLLSIGIGIGRLVGRIPGPHHTTYAYATYVAPALLASSAMNGAVYESTFNVYFKLKFARIYDAVLATPMEPSDVARGEIANAVLRGTVYAAAFVAMMVGLGDAPSVWTVLALPAAVLISAAFASVGVAATTWMRGWSDFELIQLVLLPLFLFSTTFYPLATYPRWLQLVVELTPLFHAVALTRALTLGTVTPAVVGHAAYLAVMAVAGVAVAGRRIAVLLRR